MEGGRVADSGADLLSNEEHRSFITLTFSDHDTSVHRQFVHFAAHGFDGNPVRFLAIVEAHGVGRCDRCCLGHSDQSLADGFCKTFHELSFAAWVTCLVFAGGLKAGIPVSHSPMIRLWTSCVPS